jgi:hypothetical protein
MYGIDTNSTRCSKTLNRILDLRARGNSSLEVSVTPKPVGSNFNGKCTRDTSRLGFFGSRIEYSSGVSKPLKTSKALGTQLFDASRTFDSPVELGNVPLDDIRHKSRTYSTSDSGLQEPHDELEGIKIEVENHVM